MKTPFDQADEPYPIGLGMSWPKWKISKGEYRTESVSLSKLKTPQDTVTDEGVQKYLDDPQSRGDVVVVKKGDEYHIADGNHAATAAKMRGDDSIIAKVIDAPESVEAEADEFRKHLQRKPDRIERAADPQSGGFNRDPSSSLLGREADSDEPEQFERPSSGGNLLGREAHSPLLTQTDEGNEGRPELAEASEEESEGPQPAEAAQPIERDPSTPPQSNLESDATEKPQEKGFNRAPPDRQSKFSRDMGRAGLAFGKRKAGGILQQMGVPPEFARVLTGALGDMAEDAFPDIFGGEGSEGRRGSPIFGSADDAIGGEAEQGGESTDNGPKLDRIIELLQQILDTLGRGQTDKPAGPQTGQDVLPSVMGQASATGSNAATIGGMDSVLRQSNKGSSSDDMWEAAAQAMIRALMMAAP